MRSHGAWEVEFSDQPGSLGNTIDMLAASTLARLAIAEGVIRV